MIYIAHRGNTHGPVVNKENHPDYIEDTIKSGYAVEIDVWHNPTPLNVGWWLGHDAPQHPVKWSFLVAHRHALWCHAKNKDALYLLNDACRGEAAGLRCFWHQKDNYTLTNDGHIWTYPGCDLTPSSIWVTFDLPPVVATHPAQVNCLYTVDSESVRNKYKKIYERGVKPAGICADHISLYKSLFETTVVSAEITTTVYGEIK